MNAEDPKLTAYVLDELDEEEARAIDELAGADHDLARNLSELRVLTAQIGSTLAAEAAAVTPDPRLSAIGVPLPSRRSRVVAGARSWWAGAGTLARGTAAAGALALVALLVHDGAAAARWGSYPVTVWLQAISKDHEGLEASVPEPGFAPEPPLVVAALRKLRGESDPMAAAQAQPERGRLDAMVFQRDEVVDPEATMAMLWDALAPPTSVPLAHTGSGPAPDPAEPVGAVEGESSSPIVSGGTAPVVDPMRRVIKDGTMMLETSSVEVAVGRLAAMAAAVGGYVAQTRWEHQPEAIDSAEIVISVPSGDFEAVLVRARDVGTVLSEQVTSADVSQEYVDLQSEVSNLEATRARIREFLTKTNSVEEALRVNDELTRVESEIAQRKGRLQWLTQRSAMSSLAITVLERPPRPTATRTPSPTPPVAGLGLAPWNPSDSAQVAARTVVVAYRTLANVLIWATILALAAAPVLVAAWWWRRRSQGLPASAG